MIPRNHGLTVAVLLFGAVIVWLSISKNATLAPVAEVGVSRPETVKSSEFSGVSRLAGQDLLWATDKAAEEKAPSVRLPADFPARIVSADGKSVSISLPDGSKVEGRVEAISHDEQGVQSVEGRIEHPEAGRFMFQRQKVAGKAGPLVGFIHFDQSTTAWQVRPTGEKREPMLVKTTVDRIMCRSLPPRSEPEAIPQTHPSDDPIPSTENGIIQLQSNPGSSAVVYLDFDGEERVFPLWGYINAKPSGSSNAQIRSVWQGVAEDFLPFNINITTIRSVYDQAPDGSRMHVIVTPTTDALPGAGGVAYNNSFNWTGGMVCWAFSTTGKNAVEVISHEVGHTLGLSHDGTTSPLEPYYLGHSGWAPIMGLGYYQNPSHWSKGEYANADNPQDDIQIIATTNTNVDYADDEHGDITASATWLDVTSAGVVSAEGVISSSADMDLFRFDTTGGTVALTINNATILPNLDIMAELIDGSETVVATSNSTGSLTASFSAVSLSAGTYFLRVSGTGKGNPLTTGYTDYGSLGAFTITGTINGAVPEDRFSLGEHATSSSVVGTVLPRASHGAGTPAFAILSGNTGGTFVIDTVTGQISVANASLLNFESLSTRWDVPARFELFVEITDSLSVATETIRVVIDIDDINEAPDFPPPAAVTIPERLLSGTAVVALDASDPDRGDAITWSITSGNTGSAFAVDPATGMISTAGPLDFETLSSYALTVRATDLGSPSQWTERTLVINLMNIAEHLDPGGITRTLFREIGGQSVSDLVSHSRFPLKPDSEEVLPSCSYLETDGTSHGSTFRAIMIAPQTGNYFFAVAGDDSAELLLGSDATPSSAATIASLAMRTDPGDWNAYPTQQSVAVFLTAGELRYIEVRHKQGQEAAHLQTAWQVPGTSGFEVIPGRWLVPLSEDYTPWAENTAVITRIFADVGQSVPGARFVEPDEGQEIVSYAITGGNSLGIFSINPLTGAISIANPAAMLEGDTYHLTLTATDNDSPPETGTATLSVSVVGLEELLHAWWPLDETEGIEANDASGNFRTGSLDGGAGWVPRAPANGALALDGSTASVAGVFGSGFSGATSFTVAAWVKVPTTHSGNRVLLRQQQPGTLGDDGSYIITVLADGTLRFRVRGRESPGGTIGNQFEITSTAAIDDGNWHHIACVRDGQNGRIYINGNLSASGSGSVRLLNSDLAVALGWDGAASNSYLTAEVDDIHFYADALGALQTQKVAGTPKVAITYPVADMIDVPAGVGVLLDSAASDPDGPTPTTTWSRVSGPGTVAFNPVSSGRTAVTFSDPGRHLLRLTADDGDRTVKDELVVNVGVSANSPFELSSYGDASSAGSFENAVNSYVVYGAASGIRPASTADDFVFLGQSFTGDFDVCARVDFLSDVEDTTEERAGLALRVGTAGDPDEVASFIGFSSGNTGQWILRSTVGAGNNQQNFSSPSFPSWCRIQRFGGFVRFYHSTDGTNWQQRGIVILTSEVRVGLCWASGNSEESGTAVFGGVKGFSLENLGPYVEASAGAFAYVNFPADLNGYAQDDGRPAVPGLEVEWQLASGPAAPVFNNPTNAFTTVTCTAPGSHVFRLVADDGAVRTFADVSLEAEVLDVIGVIASRPKAVEAGTIPGKLTFVREGSMLGDLVVPLVVTGTATAGVDYVALPATVTIPGGVERVTIDLLPISDLLVEGTETVTVSIGSGSFSISDDNAQVGIADFNQAPVWSSATIFRPDGLEGQIYFGAGMAGNASDPDGDLLVFSKTAGPSWLLVAEDGSLSGTPGPGVTGTNLFTVRATDTAGVFSDTMLEIHVNFINEAPVFTADPVVSGDAMAGLPYAGTIPSAVVEDPNLWQGDILEFSKTAGPSWLNVAADGSLSGTPPQGGFGPQDFTIQVEDLGGLIAQTTLRINVVPATLFFDSNGPTAGSGSPSAATWNGTALWSVSALGDIATVPWVEESHAVFSAGGDTNSTAITIVGTRSTRSLLVGEGAISLTGGSILLGGPATPFAIGGTLSTSTPMNGGGVVKSGNGTLVLEGSQPFAGPLSIDGGRTTLRGTLAGAAAVTVGAGAVLDGGGSFSSTLALAGTIAPGEGIGSIQTGPITVSNGAAIEWQCGDWTGVAGTGYDTLQASSLNLTAATSFVVRVSSSALANFSESAATFLLVQTSGGITGFNAAHASIDKTALPEAAGDWSLRVDGDDLMLDYTPPPPFVLWQIAEFAGDAGNPLIAGPTADPDRDGHSNVMEYALGTDPNLSSVLPIVQDRVDISGSDYLRLTISRNPAATDVLFEVQTSDDLEEWSATNTVVESDTPAVLVVRDSIAGVQRFIRLRVTLQTPPP